MTQQLIPTKLYNKPEFLMALGTYADNYDSIISIKAKGSSDSTSRTNTTAPAGRSKSINDLTEKEWAEWQGD